MGPWAAGQQAPNRNVASRANTPQLLRFFRPPPDGER